MDEFVKQSVFTTLFRLKIAVLIAEIGYICVNVYTGIAVFCMIPKATESELTSFLSKMNILSAVFGIIGFIFFSITVFMLLRLRVYDSGFKTAVIFGAVYLVIKVAGDIIAQSNLLVLKLIMLGGLVVFGILYYKKYTKAMLGMIELQRYGVTKKWESFWDLIKRSYYSRLFATFIIFLNLINPSISAQNYYILTFFYVIVLSVVALIVDINEARVLYETKDAYGLMLLPRNSRRESNKR